MSAGDVLFWVSLVLCVAQFVFAGWTVRSSYKLGFKHGQERAEARTALVNQIAAMNAVNRPRLVVMNPNATMPPSKDRN